MEQWIWITMMLVVLWEAVFASHRCELVTDALAVAQIRAAHFRKSQSAVEGHRSRIGRINVNLTDDPLMTRFPGVVEQAFVECAGQAPTPCTGRNDDAVDIDKPIVARFEPQEVHAVIRRILIERDQEAVASRSLGCAVEGVSKHFGKRGTVQRRRLCFMRGVQGQYVIKAAHGFIPLSRNAMCLGRAPPRL
jgi:hypothetical protein